METDPLDAVQDAFDLHQSGVFATRQIDLRLVAGDHDLRVYAKSGEEHLHLQTRRVLRFVENDEGITECTTAHESERCNFDGARLDVFLNALDRHQIIKRVVQRSQIRIDLGLHVPREKAEALTGFDGRTREHDAAHTFAHERIDGGSDREVRLACASRTDADDDIVLADLLEILRLSWRLGLYTAPRAGQHQRIAVVCIRRVWCAFDERQPQHVIGEHGASIANHRHHRGGDGLRLRHRFRVTRDREGITTQRNARSRDTRKLHEICVAYTGEQQEIGTLNRNARRRRLGHASSPCSNSAIPSSSRSAAGTATGAPSNSERAAVVFGKAITSRSDVAPESSIAMRSKPKAMPP